MTSKSFLRSIVLILLITSIVSSCRTKNQAVVDAPTHSDLTESCYTIESFSVPSCRLEISGSNIQSISLNGSIFVIPDSVFYFRGRLLIDVVRGAIYRDSFVVVNFLERTVYKGKNSFLQNMVGFPVNPKSLLILMTDDNCGVKYLNLDQNRHPFRITYNEYKQYEQFELPTLLNISVSDGGNSLRIRADLRQIELNTHVLANVTAPPNYRVVVLE